ncbi:MAG: sigma-70 family RNA polymerase sigma factor [Ruminococcus sp.]|nr:sigma-70 family RNA polymerase sigma factor [Ruminococcus sp.]
MLNNLISPLYEEFKKECKTINLLEEYSNFIGVEQWIIITDLSVDELNIKYESIIAEYSPYIKLSVAQGEPIIGYNRIEDKHRKRKKLYEDSLPDFNEDDEVYNQLSQDEDFVSDLMLREYIKEILMLIPTERQRDRIIKHYLYGKTATEIAAEENLTPQAVNQSIRAGINNLKKLLL